MQQYTNTKFLAYTGLVAALIGSGIMAHLSGNDTAQATSFQALPVHKVPGAYTVDLESIVTTYQVPLVNGTQLPPELSGASYAVYDELTGTMLAQSDQTPRPIASLTKLMTASVVLEKSALNAILPVTHTTHYGDLPAARLGLRGGEQYTVRDLLASLLITSHNDTAAFFADSLSEGKSQQFIVWMNEKAKELGMTQTRFGNSIGLDDGQTYSTPRDLALLTRSILSYSEIAEMVAQKEYEIAEHLSGRSIRLTSTNQMLNDERYRVLGVKTGQTPAAGGCLISRVDIGGHTVIIVVLGSRDRFADTRQLIDWTDHNIDWH